MFEYRSRRINIPATPFLVPALNEELGKNVAFYRAEATSPEGIAIRACVGSNRAQAKRSHAYASERHPSCHRLRNREMFEKSLMENLWLFFKARAKRPIRVERVPRPRDGKTANWPGTQGCDENGPAAVPRLRDRSRIDLDLLPPAASPARTALPAAHFDRNNIPAISGTGH